MPVRVSVDSSAATDRCRSECRSTWTRGTLRASSEAAFSAVVRRVVRRRGGHRSMPYIVMAFVVMAESCEKEEATD